MPDGSAIPCVQVREVGVDAAAAMAGCRTGRIAAVYPRSFYVETAAGWFCAGPPGLGGGPLNLICDTGAEKAWAARTISTGMPVRISTHAVDIGSRLMLALRMARPWRPVGPPPWRAATVRMGLRALDDIPNLAVPEAGLGVFLRPGASAASAESSKAAPAIARLVAWLEGDAGDTDKLPADVEQAAISLLGLGPGLTPAGDDYLGGLLIGLALTGRERLSNCLWQGLDPHVAARTVAISAAHLRAAAAGRGGATLHAAVHALMAGRAEALPDVMARIDRIGHTSGWDALAGAVTALRAVPGNRGTATMEPRQ